MNDMNCITIVMYAPNRQYVNSVMWCTLESNTISSTTKTELKKKPHSAGQSIKLQTYYMHSFSKCTITLARDRVLLNRFLSP